MYDSYVDVVVIVLLECKVIGLYIVEDLVVVVNNVKKNG